MNFGKNMRCCYIIALSQLHFPINTNENIAEIDRLPTILFSSVRSVFFFREGKQLKHGALEGVSIMGAFTENPVNQQYIWWFPKMVVPNNHGFSY